MFDAVWEGRVAETVDARDLKSLGETRAGSNPAMPNIVRGKNISIVYNVL